jgi:hypothetical protein
MPISSDRPIEHASAEKHGLEGAGIPDDAGADRVNAADMGQERAKVTIVGGGVAAMEAMIALRRLAEERVSIDLVTPTPEWSYRPMAVAEPFGLGQAKRYDLVRIAREHGATAICTRAPGPGCNTLQTMCPSRCPGHRSSPERGHRS